MKWPDPGAAPAQLANRMLEEQAWAREKLAPFAGRVFSLAVGPLGAAWSIRGDGTFDRAPEGAVADLKLAISPWSVPAFLADPARWNELVREEGDPDLGGALKDLARTWPWFVEETFAKMLGPVAGQRAAASTRGRHARGGPGACRTHVRSRAGRAGPDGDGHPGARRLRRRQGFGRSAGRRW